MGLDLNDLDEMHISRTLTTALHGVRMERKACVSILWQYCTRDEKDWFGVGDFVRAVSC